MCSSPSVPPPVTPAPAPAPAAPAPQPSVIGQARQNQNVAQSGNIDGPNTRVDRTANGPTAGLNM